MKKLIIIFTFFFTLLANIPLATSSATSLKTKNVQDTQNILLPNKDGSELFYNLAYSLQKDIASREVTTSILNIKKILDNNKNLATSLILNDTFENIVLKHGLLSFTGSKTFELNKLNKNLISEIDIKANRFKEDYYPFTIWLIERIKSDILIIISKRDNVLLTGEQSKSKDLESNFKKELNVLEKKLSLITPTINLFLETGPFEFQFLLNSNLIKILELFERAVKLYNFSYISKQSNSPTITISEVPKTGIQNEANNKNASSSANFTTGASIDDLIADRYNKQKIRQENLNKILKSKKEGESLFSNLDNVNSEEVSVPKELPSPIYDWIDESDRLKEHDYIPPAKLPKPDYSWAEKEQPIENYLPPTELPSPIDDWDDEIDKKNKEDKFKNHIFNTDSNSNFNGNNSSNNSSNKKELKVIESEDDWIVN